MCVCMYVCIVCLSVIRNVCLYVRIVWIYVCMSRMYVCRKYVYVLAFLWSGNLCSAFSLNAHLPPGPMDAPHRGPPRTPGAQLALVADAR
jgi:hypothetical protein